jgi:DNA-binding Xre family transcriptional regulator
MDIMRLRLPELLEEQQPPMTAYGLAKASGGRISRSTAYRLTRNRGVVRYLDSELLETLCDVFDLEPGELLEREKSKRRRGK